MINEKNGHCHGFYSISFLFNRKGNFKIKGVFKYLKITTAILVTN